MLAEQEATKILEMLTAIQAHLGIGGPDAEVDALQQATEPERLMEKIEQHGPAPGPGPPKGEGGPPALRTPGTER